MAVGVKKMDRIDIGEASNDSAYITADRVAERQGVIIDALQNDAAIHQALLRHARVRLRIMHAPENFDAEEARRVVELISMATFYLARNQLHAEKSAPHPGKQLLNEVTTVMDMIIETERQVERSGR
jgi:hypothetical protein